MKKIAFVILHYMTAEDTIECIDSIRRCCTGGEYQIIIVDNASPNKSGPRLYDLYQASDDVDVLIMDENLGFAKGNNSGIDFAKTKYDPDFVITLNNDVLLLQSNTIELIEQEYEQSNFSVMGPMIYTADGKCNDNPGVAEPMTLDGVNDVIKEGQKHYFLCKWRLGSLYSFFLKIKNKIVKDDHNDVIHRQYLKKEYNVQLHGCFLCFSRDYFKTFKGFYPETFLYMEEDILFYLIRKENLITVYDPKLKVFHKEDSASNAVWRTKRNRSLNKMSYVLKSAKELKKLLLKDSV